MNKKLLLIVGITFFLIVNLGFGNCVEPTKIEGLTLNENSGISVTGSNIQGNFDVSSGMNQLTCNSKESPCELFVGKKSFKNFKGGPILLDTSGEIKEAEFEIEKPGGEYTLGGTNFKISSGKVKYKNGVLELPENAEITKSKNSKISGNNLKFSQDDEEHIFSGENLNFDRDGTPYAEKDTKLKIDDITLITPKGISDSDTVKIFFDGKQHNNKRGAYISYNKNGAVLKGLGGKGAEESWKKFTVDLSKSKLFGNTLENNKFEITPAGGSTIFIKKGKEFLTVTPKDGDAFTTTIGNKQLIFERNYGGTLIRKNPREGNFSAPKVRINTLQTKVYVDGNQNLYTTDELKPLDNSVTSPSIENRYKIANVLYSPGDPKRFFKKGYKTFKKVELAREILNKGLEDNYNSKLKKWEPKLNLEKLRIQAENYDGSEDDFINKIIKPKFGGEIPYLKDEQSNEILKNSKSFGEEYNYKNYQNDFGQVQDNLGIDSTKGTKEKETNLYGIRNAIWGELLDVRGYYHYYDSPRNLASKN